MGKRVLKGGALLAPLPCALISCKHEGKINVLTVAWTGIISTIPPRTYISVRPSRHSHRMIEESGEFVINLCPSSLAKVADFCGMYTGAKVDKFAKCGLTPIESQTVSAPTIDECPIALECKVVEKRQEGSHDMFIADITSVSADDELFDGNGKLRYERADLCAYSHGEYYSLGRKLGYFGFSAVKKHRRR